MFEYNGLTTEGLHEVTAWMHERYGMPGQIPHAWSLYVHQMGRVKVREFVSFRVRDPQAAIDFRLRWC
jgi:hypothetical protein